jgi:hypothetical protein
MIIGSEAEGHGIQIFDMKKLLEIDPAKPVTFSNTKDLVGHFKGLPIGRTRTYFRSPCRRCCVDWVLHGTCKYMTCKTPIGISKVMQHTLSRTTY